MVPARRIVLASTSTYRRELLGRLGLDFVCAAPDVDEAALDDERPAATAARLAEYKARAVADRYPDALVIGADQVAAIGEQRLGKPGSHDAAARQLQTASGKAVDFHTAVCLLDARSSRAQCRVVPCRVVFRKVSARQIDAYLRREQPYDCAASAKAEGLGIALIERIETSDPTSLIGLPLIALTELLADAGSPVLE